MAAPERSEDIVSWCGSLLKARTGICSGVSLDPRFFGCAKVEELSYRVQTLADSCAFAYALRGEKRSEPARQAARFVTVRIPGVPSAGRCRTISSVSWESC